MWRLLLRDKILITRIETGRRRIFAVSRRPLLPSTRRRGHGRSGGHWASHRRLFFLSRQHPRQITGGDSRQRISLTLPFSPSVSFSLPAMITMGFDFRFLSSMHVRRLNSSFTSILTRSVSFSSLPFRGQLASEASRRSKVVQRPRRCRRRRGRCSRGSCREGTSVSRNASRSTRRRLRAG